MMATMMYVAHSDPTFSTSPRGRSLISSVKHNGGAHHVCLPADAEQLKQFICKTHPTKYYSFNLVGMRKLAMPPVRIPSMYRNTRTTIITVGGKPVPYTREMWLRQQRVLAHPMDCIVEADENAATDRRK